eukprot:m.66204 g.66204  ORF g.66204 m.66204 type:complete len:296 (+) comp11789_c0_seq2:153-1040(+)
MMQTHSPEGDNKRRRVGEDDAIMSGSKHIVTPGSRITDDKGFIRGHGTFMEGGELCASLAGAVERVNKLIFVRPLKSRYVGEVGDVVVGRITDVGQKKWKVDCHGRTDAILMLSSVNLPGGVLRRRGAEDELMMRQFFVEGDVITCEVQSLYHDGTVSLHTRSLKYGKMQNGSYFEVPCALVRRCKNHFHMLPCGVGVVLGNNGYIWVGVSLDPLHPGAQQEQSQTMVTLEERKKIARVRNCILALASQKLAIFDTSVIYCYEDSEQFDIPDLLNQEVVPVITVRAKQACATMAT